MKYLLDTCVLSELVKPSPEPAVLQWMAARQDREIFASAMALAELHRGVEKLPVSRRRNELSEWLQQLEANLEDRVLAFTQETGHYWAQMVAKAEAAGQSMAAFDSIIAATALEHGLALVTRNVRDFAQAPVVVVNPWQAGATVGLSVADGQLVVNPRLKPRYTMAELLAASDYSHPPSAEEREWIDAPAVGGELL